MNRLYADFKWVLANFKQILPAQWNMKGENEGETVGALKTDIKTMICNSLIGHERRFLEKWTLYMPRRRTLSLAFNTFCEPISSAHKKQCAAVWAPSPDVKPQMDRPWYQACNLLAVNQECSCGHLTLIITGPKWLKIHCTFYEKTWH